MESVTKSRLLEIPPNAIEEIKKIHNLDKPGRVDEAVDLLEAWLQKQDHILKKDFSRLYLEKTLILAKGSVEKAKKTIDRLCTMKTLLPHFFTKTNVKEELSELLKYAFVIPLPIVTKDFYRVVISKINNAEGHNYTLEYFQYIIIIAEYLKAHDYIDGFIMIFDYRQSNILELVTKINPVHLQQFLSILIEGFGARVKGVYLLTPSRSIELLVALGKPFLSQKIVNRMKVVKNLEELHENVPKYILPVEYGGEERSCSRIADDWTEVLSSEEFVNYMKMMNKACTNEKLRRSNEFNEEYMGMPGSFRNLTVD